MEVVEGLYRLDAGQGVNVYLWRPADGRDDGAPLLFDCGWPWAGLKLVAGLMASWAFGLARSGQLQ